MSTGLSSSLNWITFKSEDVQKAREILKELGPDSTVDSIGLGLPLEEISNILFPATSTLHTRLRYQLFVPAIICKMYFEANKKPLKNPEKRLFELEVTLMNVMLFQNLANSLYISMYPLLEKVGEFGVESFIGVETIVQRDRKAHNKMPIRNLG